MRSGGWKVIVTDVDGCKKKKKKKKDRGRDGKEMLERHYMYVCERPGR